jgi:hypothetical protein
MKRGTVLFSGGNVQERHGGVSGIGLVLFSLKPRFRFLPLVRRIADEKAGHRVSSFENLPCQHVKQSRQLKKRTVSLDRILRYLLSIRAAFCFLKGVVMDI